MALNNSSQIPYDACLMTFFPEEMQHRVRDITNHVIIPVNMIVAVMSFVCNALVVFAVARNKNLQRPPQIMLCSLAITDLIYAAYCLVGFVDILTHEHMCPDRSHDAVKMFAPFCVLATLGNLGIISRDRYLAVKRPLWYRNHVTKVRAVKMICVPWFLSAVISCLIYTSRKFPDRFPPIGQVTSVAFYLLCFLVISFSNLGLFCKKTSSEVALNIRAILEREKRMANTFGLILLVLLVTFLPGVLIPITLNAKGVPNFVLYKRLYDFLFLLNGFLNPLLNFGRNKGMRRALLNPLNCLQQVQPQEERHQ